MNKFKSLVKGIGNNNETQKYYDDWSINYDKTLDKWNYKAPFKSCLILKHNLVRKPKQVLDLACGTGLFASNLIKFFPKVLIDGIDISQKSIEIAKKKKIYNQLYKFNFNKKFLLKKKYDLISCIGSMTYSKNPQNLILEAYKLTNINGCFIFTHRVDLWKKQNLSLILKNLNNNWKKVFISGPTLYLPKNKDFGDKIKIKIVLLKKIT